MFKFSQTSLLDILIYYKSKTDMLCCIYIRQGYSEQSSVSCNLILVLLEFNFWTIDFSQKHLLKVAKHTPLRSLWGNRPDYEGNSQDAKFAKRCSKLLSREKLFRKISKNSPLKLHFNFKAAKIKLVHSKSSRMMLEFLLLIFL